MLKEAKRRVLETLLTSEFTVLTRLLARIASGHYSTRDYSADSLRQALELYVLHFPVYRTYLTSSGPTGHDRKLISETIEKARADWFAADDGIFDFLRDTLTMDLVKPGRAAAQRAARAPVRAEGAAVHRTDDGEVARGHDVLPLPPPARAQRGRRRSGRQRRSPSDAFHEMMRTRAKEWPHGMTATATHDTKRGEDARTRIMALAEIPGEWTSAVARWKLLNAPHLVDQMAICARRRRRSNTCCIRRCWAPGSRTTPRLRERMQAYALKAAREGKQETSWLNPHEPYEAGVKNFIARILDPSLSGEFLDSLQTLAQRLSLLGALNSLSQITLKATMPGVPDFYQGTELWDFSLVDPDNRRPVDFAARAPAAGDAGGAGLGSAGAGMAERPFEAGLDPASAEAAHRTGRRVHGRRLRAAGSDRAASRSFHRICAAARPRGRDRRGPAMVRCIHRPGPKLAGFGDL